MPLVGAVAWPVVRHAVLPTLRLSLPQIFALPDASYGSHTLSALRVHIHPISRSPATPHNSSN